MAEVGAIFGNCHYHLVCIAIRFIERWIGAAGSIGAVAYFCSDCTAKPLILPPINMSFFGGIFAGIIAGHNITLFHAASPPEWLAFSGKLSCSNYGWSICLVAVRFLALSSWAIIQGGIDALSSRRIYIRCFVRPICLRYSELCSDL